MDKGSDVLLQNETIEGSTKMPEVGQTVDTNERPSTADDDGWAAALRAQGKLPPDESCNDPPGRQLKIYDDLWENKPKDSRRRTARWSQHSNNQRREHFQSPTPINIDSQDQAGNDNGESESGNRNGIEGQRADNSEKETHKEDEIDEGIEVAQRQDADRGKENNATGSDGDDHFRGDHSHDLKEKQNSDSSRENDDGRNETVQEEATTPRSLRDDTWGFIRHALPPLSPPKVLQDVAAEKNVETAPQSWTPNNAFQTWETEGTPQMATAEEVSQSREPDDIPHSHVGNEVPQEWGIDNISNSREPESAPQTSTLNADAQSWTPNEASQISPFDNDDADASTNFCQSHDEFAGTNVNPRHPFRDGDPGETNTSGDKERRNRSRRGYGGEGNKGARTGRGNRNGREGRNNRNIRGGRENQYGRGGRENQSGRGGRDGQTRRSDRSGYGGRNGRDSQSNQDFRNDWNDHDGQNHWGNRVSRENRREEWDGQGNWGSGKNWGGRVDMNNEEGKNEQYGRVRRSYRGGRDGRDRRDGRGGWGGRGGRGRRDNNLDNSIPHMDLHDAHQYNREDYSQHQHRRQNNRRGDRSQTSSNEFDASNFGPATFESQAFRGDPIVEVNDTIDPIMAAPQEWTETQVQTWPENEDTAAQAIVQPEPPIVVQDQPKTENPLQMMDDMADSNATTNMLMISEGVQTWSCDEN